MSEDRVPLIDVRRQYEEHAEEINARVQAVLASGQYAAGAEVRALETAFASYCGVRHAVAVAQIVAEIYEGLGFISLFLLMAGLAAFGGLVIWKGPVPRWVGAIGVLSGLSLVLAFIGGWFIADAFWWGLIVGVALGVLEVIATGAWLALKGVYVPAVSRASA